MREGALRHGGTGAQGRITLRPSARLPVCPSNNA